MYVLGVSCYYHDSAATLLKNGEIVCAAQEERFTREKHDASFPLNAIKFCLADAEITLQDVDYVVYYEKPLVKFERILEMHLLHCPRGYLTFVKSMPLWIKEKMFFKSFIRKQFSQKLSLKKKKIPPVYFSYHHQSHAASAFYPSPYEKSLVLCIDGVGEWSTTSLWIGEKNNLRPIWELRFPHSLGLLYSAFTFYLGFKVNSSVIHG